MIKRNLRKLLIIPTLSLFLFTEKAFPGADPQDKRNAIEFKISRPTQIEFPKLIKVHKTRSEQQPKPIQINVIQKTPNDLKTAIKKGNLKAVQKICKEFPGYVKTKDTSNNQSIHHAARSVHENALAILMHLLFEVDGVFADEIINAAGGLGYTPLDCACLYGLPEVKDFLITYGAESTLSQSEAEAQEESEESDSDFNTEENEEEEETEESLCFSNTEA